MLCEKEDLRQSKWCVQPHQMETLRPSRYPHVTGDSPKRPVPLKVTNLSYQTLFGCPSSRIHIYDSSRFVYSIENTVETVKTTRLSMLKLKLVKI